MTEPLGYTSTTIQRLRRLQGRRSSRSEEGAFVVEGPVLVAEAIAAGWEIEAQFVAPGVSPVTVAGRAGGGGGGGGAGPRVAGGRGEAGNAGVVRTLAPGVAERITATETPTGLFAIARARRVDPAVLATAGFVLVADRLADPGNLGTILRSAEVAGIEAVVLTPGSVDVLNPKVVRASAGAVFHVPVLAADLAAVRNAGLRLVGTSSHRGVTHTALDWSGRVAIVLGNEAHGLPDDAPVDDWVRIDHHGRSESLNVAMAATILCFDAARARP